MVEIGFHLFRSSLHTSQVRTDLPHHLRPILRPLPADGIGLDILIQILVRIQIRAVPRQKKQLNPTFLPGHPPIHGLGEMDWMTVDDQEDRPIHLTQQPSQKPDHHRGRKPLPKHHKGQSSPTGHRRDQVTSEPLARPRNHRRVPFAAVTASGLMIRPHSHLVAPMDFGLVFQGQTTNPRILAFQPLLDGLRIPFIRPSQRLLRRKAPPFQVSPDRPDRQRQAISTLDQVCHRLPSPESKRQFQLVRATVFDQGNDRGRLNPRQTRPGRSTPFACLQYVSAPCTNRFEPIVNRGPTHAEHPNRFDLRHPFVQDRRNHPLAKGFLGFRTQLSSIVRFHPPFYDGYSRMFNILCSG